MKKTKTEKQKITCPDCSKCYKRHNCDEFKNLHTVTNILPDYEDVLRRRAGNL